METLIEQRIAEAIPSFANYIPAFKQKEARDKWDPITQTHEGEIECIDAARAHDETAINYLFLRLLPQIGKTFWTNFLGPNPAAQKHRINNEQAMETFAGMAYEAFLNDGSEGGSAPLVHFDPSKFDNQTDIIDKLGYYITSALSNESLKYNRNRDRGGFTGNIPKGDRKLATVDSLDAHLDGDGEEGTRREIADARSHTFDDATANVDAWGTFCEDDDLDDAGRGRVSTRQVLVSFLKVGSTTEVAKALEIQNSIVLSKMRNVPSILARHGLDEGSFANLLASASKDELIAVLE